VSFQGPAESSVRSGVIAYGGSQSLGRHSLHIACVLLEGNNDMAGHKFYFLFVFDFLSLGKELETPSMQFCQSARIISKLRTFNSDRIEFINTSVS